MPVAGGPGRRAGGGGTPPALLPGWAFLEHPACKAGAAVAMLLVAYGRSEKLLRTGGLFLVLSCAFGGLLLLVSWPGGPVIAGGLLGPSLGMRGILIAAALCYGLLSLVLGRQFTHTRTGGELQELTLTRQGRSVKLLALRDTGNTLQDPLTGRPVVVVEGEKLRPLLPELPRLDRRSTAHRWNSSGTWRGRQGTCGSSCCPIGRWGECGLLLALRVDRANCGGGEVRTASPPSLPPRCRTAGGTAPSSAARGREHTMTGGMGMKKPWARWRWALGGWLARLRLWQPGKLAHVHRGSDVLPAP